MQYPSRDCAYSAAWRSGRAAARSGDFVAEAKIAWRDAYEMQMRAAAPPLAQAAE
jgi:hypothetical protein